MPDNQSNTSEQSNRFHLRSEHVQELLSKVPHWMIRWGNLLILLILIGLLVFSYVIKYPDIINADVVITTQIPPEKLVARQTGKIQYLLVKDKTFVKKHTPIAIIENSADYKELFQLKLLIDSIEVKENRLIFPIEQFKFLKLGQVQKTYHDFEQAYMAYNLNLRLNPFKVEKYHQELDSLELVKRIVFLSNQKAITQKELAVKRNQVDRYKRLFDKGVIALEQFEQEQSILLQLEKSYQQLKSQLSQLQTSKINLNQNKQLNEIQYFQDQSRLFKTAIQRFYDLKKAILEWELKYVIRNSISGELSYIKFWSEYQVVLEGDLIFSVIPNDGENYLARVKASRANSGKIKVGQKVIIRLINFPEREYGTIQGEVKTIAMVPDQEGFINLDVQLPKGLKSTGDKDIVFQQEMVGRADIITEDLRLIERLLYQFRDVFSR